MKDLDFRLLEVEDIEGKNRLDIFDKYGTKAAMTDFAILLGGSVHGDYTNEGNELKDRTGWYFTKTYDVFYNIQSVNHSGGFWLV